MSRLKHVEGKFLLVSLFCIVGIITSCILKNRAICIGICVSLWLILLGYWPEQKRRILLCGSLLIVLLTVIALLLKLDSSRGRLFIYKISFQILVGHWVHGIGFGAFKKVYMDYQGSYFASGLYSTKELLLADSTIYAFNDYFQIIIENGVLGFLFVTGYLRLWYIFIRFSLHNPAKQNLLFYLALVAGITLSAAALFTHVYDVFSYQIILVIAALTLLYYVYKPFLSGHVKYLLAIVGLAIICSTEGANRLFHYKAYNAFEESRDLSKAGFKKEALDSLQSIYPTLKEDGYYLSVYGQQLLYDGQDYKAVLILQQALNKIASADDYVRVAQGYNKLQQFPKAEQAYITAIHMVPNRFRSRFELYQFYKQQREDTNAKAVAMDILKLPIKIPSSIIDYIKASVSHDLKVTP